MIRRAILTLLLIVGIFLMASTAKADISYDNSLAVIDQSGTDNQASGSLSIGQGGGNNRIVIITIQAFDTTSGDLATGSVTVNGTSATHIETQSGLYSPYGYYYTSQLFYILDANLPASSGSYTVAFTGASGSVVGITIKALSLYGAKQEAPEAVAYTSPNPASSATASQSITTLTDNAWICTCVASAFYGYAISSYGTGQTSRVDDGSGGGMSTEAKATAGADTQSCTWAATDDVYLMHSLSVAPYVAPSSSARSGTIINGIGTGIGRGMR